MRILKACVVLWVTLALAGLCVAAPAGGSWDTDDGDFDAGIWQEVFYGSGEGQPGNEIIAAGLEWYLEGAILESHEWLLDEPNKHVHKTIYTGATLTLDVDGPWETAGDTLPYIASLGDLVVITTKLFDDDGNLTSLSWKIKTRGVFDDYDDRYVIIRASYSGIPDPIEQGQVPGMTDEIDRIIIDIGLIAKVRITPRTLNLSSKGKWITAKISLPEDVDVADIDVDSLLLNKEVESAWAKVVKGGKALMVKFPRDEVQATLDPGNQVSVLITGELDDGTPFRGWDKIRVIDKGNKPVKNAANKAAKKKGEK
jgi:hypothetical protein